MDLYVERQCIDQMKAGELRQFMLLFDAYFDDVYKYVTRRVGEGEAAEKIARLTFLDALGQVQNTPTDSSYAVWMYSLARPRVVDQIENFGFPKVQGVISSEEKVLGQNDATPILEKAERTFGKMSMEEREILRLKFFEEVADGDVMTVLGIEEGIIGPKIYRVLKRAHFLLFGESDERQGVYFGELSGFLARIRELEDIKVPVAFKLGLRADLSGRIDRHDFAIEAEEVLEKGPKKAPFDEKNAPKGSNDPAKIFVAAVKEMREEEAREKMKEQQKADRRENFFDLAEKWKGALVFVPMLVVALVVGFAVFNFVDFKGPLERGFPTECGIEVVFEGEFSDREMRNVNAGVSDRLCDHFEVKSLKIARSSEGQIDVEVDVPDWFLEYGFVKKVQNWRIKKYARTPYSNQEPGQISGNS